MLMICNGQIITKGESDSDHSTVPSCSPAALSASIPLYPYHTLPLGIFFPDNMAKEN